MAVRVLLVVALLGMVAAGGARAEEPPPPPQPPPTSSPWICAMNVGDVVRLELLDGRTMRGCVMEVSEASVRISTDSLRWGYESIALTSIATCEIESHEADGGNCTTPFCSPAWAREPDRTAVWLDGSAGKGGTNKGAGNLFGIGLSHAIDRRQIIRARWIGYADESESERTPPADSFDSYALLYGGHTRYGRFLALATAGLGYSEGTARGEHLFTSGNRRWYTPLRYRAASVVGEAQVGLAWRTFGFGAGLVGDANPRRQSWAWQVTIAYGSLPRYRNEGSR